MEGWICLLISDSLRLHDCSIYCTLNSGLCRLNGSMGYMNIINAQHLCTFTGG